MRGRIAGLAACVGVLVSMAAGEAHAAPPPLDDVAAVRAALQSAAMPISTRTAQSITTTIERVATGTPRYNYFPRSVHLVEGTAQPFLYDTTAADCLPAGFGEQNDSVGIARAIAGPAVDENLPVPVIPPGKVNVFFSGINTAMSSPLQADLVEVAWLNLTTMQSGRAPLYQERPADYIVTLSNTLETGRGTIVFVVFGSILDNTSRALPPCDYAPVVGVVQA
ncbi:hypothetical protein GXW84_07605 [Rhodococcus sp. IEGM 248]|uniref:Rv1157c family protein n=1 Tax=Rhodococcus sp. ACPA1 TaxID=2028572 RepID=UPI00076A1F6A|nr:hypothetical protein [Rhodococcus sp. ACPA1]KXF49605.1 hypothetical protein AXA44_01570 [Rhodococcus sp. SC4]NDV04405.1 hypothetical protein [Rhodococcus sp. IEGM 248]PBC56916.1 hypothetical protein CJ177_15110 [Rhodococcus sp. ACPA1]